jgi:CRISPR-associated protein Csx14
LPFPTRNFTMQLDWPGQENQARCITTVREETLDDHVEA